MKRKVTQQCATCKYWQKGPIRYDIPFFSTDDRGICLRTMSYNYEPNMPTKAVAYERKGRPCVLITTKDFYCPQWQLKESEDEAVSS